MNLDGFINSYSTITSKMPRIEPSAETVGVYYDERLPLKCSFCTVPNPPVDGTCKPGSNV